MTFNASNAHLPDWWQREKQRRLVRVLLFLVFVIALIGYFYYLSTTGLTGIVNGISFDTKNYIVFVRDDGKGHTDLYAVRMDGTDLRRLTDASDTSTKADPAWAVDGKSVLYASNRDSNHIAQIYILGAGQPKQLTYGTGNKSCLIACPDGQHAGFICRGAVKTVFLNGEQVRQIMPQPRSGNEDNGTGTVATSDLSGPYLSYAFSGDGGGVAGAQELADESSAVAVGHGGVDMVVSAIPVPDGATLFLSKGHEVSVAWEKNGKRLACAFTELHAPNNAERAAQDMTPNYKDWLDMTGGSKDTTLVSGIEVFTFGGKVPTKSNLFAGIGYSYEPKNITWSPDGSKIAFEAWRLSGDGQRQLSGIAVQVLDATSGSEGVRVDPQHLSNLKFLTTSGPDGQPQNPKWSPDSQHILFEMLKNGKRDLFSINADGTNEFNLTKGLGDNHDGSWSPAQ